MRAKQSVEVDGAGDSGCSLPFWKRGLDIAVIFLLSPAVLLVSACIALIIKCGSRGPVIFRQARVGQGGREFMCYKFRTMHAGAEIGSHRDYTRQLIQSKTPMTKLDARRDPRLIPLGKVLRATGLDELPQLVNVLHGEMSIVGPRPCMSYEYEVYTPHQRHRLDAAPGLTGLWQVSGKNRTTFDEMVELDIEYARRKSLWMDIFIILKTFPALMVQCRDIGAAEQQRPSKPTSGIGKTPESYRL
jgi:exopolysaccharide production protein ExoY